MNWKLYIAPNCEVKDFDPKIISELESCMFDPIDAKVPGNFELDMLSAGLIEDPYYGVNTLKMQELENRHLWYTATFDNIENKDNTKETFLVFEGIDTVSDIYLNGSLLGHTDNMFMSYEYLVDRLLREKDNELIVHIYPTTIYSRQIELTPLNYAMRYTYGSLGVRKAASMFGWDIMPRIISGGLWKPVKLIQKPKERIEDAYIYTVWTDPNSKSARINVFYNIHTDADLLSDMYVSVSGKCGDSCFEFRQKLFHTFGTINYRIEDCLFWWPKNYGGQNLYDVQIRLFRNSDLLDEKNMRIGVRTVELIRTSTTDAEGKGEFCFKINGKKIFALGTNWVPLDAFHSRDIDRLPEALSMLEDIGCNAVRCWGGNVYENDEFFSFCDEKGIMVWQDFAMGCGVYPQDDKFNEILAKEAAFIIKKLRNHCSIVLWAGDNECDVFHGNHGIRCNPNQNLATRKVIAEMVRMHDFARPYLPSSPYVDEQAFITGKPISEDHLWGPRDYFKGDYYRTTVCHFASETGYHGCPSPESLEKYIPKDKLWPMFDPRGNTIPEWQVHSACMETEPAVEFSYRIGLMARQVQTLFGSMPDNLPEFARMSQISQAEAKKYFIERFRLSKWRRTGIIWWNLIDGWPQISDAVVDYYYCRKLAYHYIKRSQAPVCLMFDEPCNNVISLYAVNDTAYDRNVKYMVIRAKDNAVVAQKTAKAAADSSVVIDSVVINEGEKSFYYIEWELDNGTRGFNHYFTNIIDIDYDEYMEALVRFNMDQFEGF